MARALEVGNLLFIQRAGKYFRIAGTRELADQISVVLTASQVLSNQELTTLKSPNDRIYHLRSIGLENDVLFTYKYNQNAQIGIKAPANLNIRIAPWFNPFQADNWMYNTSPFYDITENAAIATTAVIQLRGEEYLIEEWTGGKPAVFTAVDG